MMMMMMMTVYEYFAILFLDELAKMTVFDTKQLGTGG